MHTEPNFCHLLLWEDHLSKQSLKSQIDRCQVSSPSNNARTAVICHGGLFGIVFFLWCYRLINTSDKCPQFDFQVIFESTRVKQSAQQLIQGPPLWPALQEPPCLLLMDGSSFSSSYTCLSSSHSKDSLTHSSSLSCKKKLTRCTDPARAMTTPGLAAGPLAILLPRNILLSSRSPSHQDHQDQIAREITNNAGTVVLNILNTASEYTSKGRTSG